MAAAILDRLAEILPEDRVSVDPRTRQSNSEDYAWFSNVLEEDLGGCRADVVAWPTTAAELADVLAAAHGTRTPVTARGGGTGNYGQCVPVRGGLVVNLTRMNRVLELGDGLARVEAGVRFADLDRAANAVGQEIHIYPSTYLTATVCGFVAGGSGGIGSVAHGVIADGNVLAATVYPVRDTPKRRQLTGAELSSVIHAYGTTGVLADVTVPLARRIGWEQAVYSFPDIVACHAFALELMEDGTVPKRLLSSVEPGITRYFGRARLPFPAERTSAILMYGLGHRERVETLAGRQGGCLEFALPQDSRTRLSDFTWNHTTLWAKKADDSLTYLQTGWSVERFGEQVHAIQAEYGEDFAVHCEYFRADGSPFTAALPIVRYRGREHLDRMVEFVESVGVGVANPHRYVLEEGSKVENVEELLRAKRENDPAGLLNPGKFQAAFTAGEQTGHTFKPASMTLARQRVL
ncbi:MAG TPA: FAD-binding oxidoreductase [Chloroflexota bacterium]|nr:FAD-binding oxidoreductase [Chloroflexota bacterium]